MLEVILDYGRRFPDVKIKDLGLNFSEELLETKIFQLFVLKDYLDDYLECSCKTCYVFRYNNHILYFSNANYKWEKVPPHVILRFLTEGKEDLI